MRGIYIDPFTKTVEEVQTTGKLAEIYSLLGVELITVVQVGDDDALFLDDEGLFVPASEQAYFHWRGSRQPFAGKGLILGTDHEGDSTDAAITLADARRAVTWIANDEVFPEDHAKVTVYFLEGDKWIKM